MDFSYLMDLAKQNKEDAQNQGPKRCLSTQFSKPKKLERSRVKSSAVQKFLAKRDSEEQRKAQEAAEKKEKLLSLRAQEKGTKRRVSAMLNRNKAANKSVLDDARDEYNTAATVDGVYQPDTDDYGYVSKEAEQMYARLLQRYEQLPDETYRKKEQTKSAATASKSDLSATKARVKESLDSRDIEERESHSRKRHRKPHRDQPDSAASAATSAAGSGSGRQEASRGGAVKAVKPRLNTHRQAPPPGLTDYNSILRLAAEKQNQPLPPAPGTVSAGAAVGPGAAAAGEAAAPPGDRQRRPMTASQQREAELERQRRLRKLGKLPPARSATAAAGGDGDASSADTTSGATSGSTSGKILAKSVKKQTESVGGASVKKLDCRAKETVAATPVACASRDKQRESTGARCRPDPAAGVARSERSGQKASVHRADRVPARPVTKAGEHSVKRTDSGDSASLQKRPPGVAMGKASSSDAARRAPGPALARPRLDPPNKRAGVIDSDSEEYDSEMDDFIDDGPLPGQNDYSSAIKEIFGYDRSKFRDEDDNCSDMEADFSTVMKEERRSEKIAKMEDEEEFRKEIANKKRKMALKSKFW